MVYDNDLAIRIRNILPNNGLISERRMFGSLAFMYQNNMVCGVVEESLMARVGPTYYEEALNNEYTSEMDLTGRSMRNIVIISPDGLLENEDLAFWVNKCLDFCKSLPPKIKTEKKPRKKTNIKRKIL